MRTVTNTVAVGLQKGVIVMSEQERYAREYCKAHGIKCRIMNHSGRKELRTWSPITAGYSTVMFDILQKTTNEIRVAIEQHVAVFLH